MEPKIDRDRSFAYFVYPFLFDLPVAGPAARNAANPTSDDPFLVFAKRVDKAEFGGSRIWDTWDIPANDLMPHVAHFFDPDPKEKVKPTARFWRIGNDLKQKHLTKKIEWRLLRKRDPAISFVLDPSIQAEGEKPRQRGDFVLHLALFRHGVGFITVSAQPVSDDLGSWLAFLHDFRFMGHRGDVEVCAEKETYDQVSKQKARAVHNPLDILISPDSSAFCFMDVLKAFLKATAIHDAEVFTPGHTLPHASLFVRGADEGDRAVIIHRVRNFFGPKQGANASAEDLCARHPAHLPYARDQWFLQTLDGGSFIAFENDEVSLDEFQQHVLPGHLRNVYFLVSLLALYQRFALARLSERVATKALDGEDKEWEMIRDDLLDFTARGYFTQTAQSDHHHRYYRKWQEVLQIPQLYEEVRKEVQDLYERAALRLQQDDDEREKREERLLSLLALLFVVPALILGILGVNIRGYTSRDDGLSLTAVLCWLIAGLVLVGLLYWLLRWFGWLGNNRKPTRGGGHEP